MKLPLDRLTESPASFEYEADAAWWRAALSGPRGSPGELDEPLHFCCRAHWMGENIYLDGDVKGVVQLECGRCLARYGHQFSEGFRLVLEPAGGRVPADPEGVRALDASGVWLEDDLEAGWFRGVEVDLDALFVEVVALALPVKPLCREDCAGLCPQCGADLAADRCSCSEVRSNSPFAVLAGIRDGLSRGEN